MNPHSLSSHRLTLAAFALAALTLAAAGCASDGTDSSHAYSGGYTGNAASVDEDNAMVNYDYTFDGPRSVTILPEKLEAAAGEEISVKITIKNTGTQPFYAPNKLSQKVTLLSRYDEKKEETTETTTGAPVMLKCHAVAPGDSVSLSVNFTAGAKPGPEILYTNLSGPSEEVTLQVK